MVGKCFEKKTDNFGFEKNFCPPGAPGPTTAYGDTPGTKWVTRRRTQWSSTTGGQQENEKCTFMVGQ
jgi:hypothetical protein